MVVVVVIAGTNLALRLFPIALVARLGIVVDRIVVLAKSIAWLTGFFVGLRLRLGLTHKARCQ